MKILSVDPGNHQSAFVLYENGKILEYGLHVNDKVHDHIKFSSADFLAIEMIRSYGMAVGQDVFDTCLWIGRFVETWVSANPKKNYFLIPRKTITTHICGTVRAADANVRRALIDILGGIGTSKQPGNLYGIRKDMWSAVALAVTCNDLYIEPFL